MSISNFSPIVLIIFIIINPTVGRWLAKDPKGFVDGMHLYCFNGNNPLINKGFKWDLGGYNKIERK